ncbi:MAG: protein-tyrosine-phosphatase [Crocinitomicaceae bacterium]|jgi:protein-tyrosine-phosphatase
MNAKLTQFSEETLTRFDEISFERKSILENITRYIQNNLDSGKVSKLMFICTHNSRRSHFGQILCAIAAEYYQIPGVQTYSAGTEITAFHPNAISALRKIGLDIEAKESGKNAHFQVQINSTTVLQAYSKLITDDINPKNEFAAIMTCTQAEENCPFVAGAAVRIGLPFDDPKAFDGTNMESEMYLSRLQEMATQLFYVFSLLKT